MIYYVLDNGSKYKLEITNSFAVKCDMMLEIDGEHMGSWRMSPHQRICLERPAHTPHRFTFYRVKHAEDAQEEKTRKRRAPSDTGINASNPNNGLITCTFTPHAIQAGSCLVDCLDAMKEHGYEFSLKPGPKVPILKEATLHLILRLRGGGGDPEPEMPCVTDDFCMGATTLQGKSMQTFGKADYIPLSHMMEHIEQIRLVTQEDELHNLSKVDLITPCIPLKR